MTYPPYAEKTADILQNCTYISCVPAGGGIAPALCARPSEKRLPANIVSAHCAKSSGLFFLFTEGGLYLTADHNIYSLIDGAKRTGTFMTEYADEGDTIAVAVAEGVMYLHGKNSLTTDIPSRNIRCGTYRRGRLFGALSDDKNRIVWSRTDAVKSFDGGIDGGGYFDLTPARGSVLDTCEYNGKLIAVRTYGLSVLSAYGAPENFSEEITDTDCAQIYENTAAVAGGKLVFLTRAGLCAYDGSRISALPAPEVENPVCAVAHGGLYLLACDCEAMGGRTVLCCDIESGVYYFIDVAADALCVKDCVYAYSGNKIYTLEKGGNFECVARFGFGTDKNKTVTEIRVGGTADLELSNGTVSRAFTGVSGAVRPRMRGKNFTLKIRASGAVEYVDATAEVSVGI